MTQSKRQKAQITLAYLTEKRDETYKGRTIYNGKPTWEWLSKENSASPTASLEAILLTVIIDTGKERDITTIDIPNTFIQTPMEIKEGEEQVIMKIAGVMVNILVDKNLQRYLGYVVY